MIALAVVFGKNERDDLSPADRRAVAAAVEAFGGELDAESRRDQVRHPGHGREEER